MTDGGVAEPSESADGDEVGGGTEVAGGAGRKARRQGRPGRTLGVVTVMVLGFTGVGLLLAANEAPGRTARVVGGNLPLDPGATDPLDVTIHNSPTIRANPTNPSNLAVADRIESPRGGCALHVSLDGGANWSQTAVPALNAKANPCYSPDLDFGADGTLYLSFTSFAKVEGAGIVPDAVWVAVSHDGGRTLSEPTRASGPLAFQVRLAAHPTRPNRLYLTWVQASSVGSWGFTSDSNPIVVSRSYDGGATWADPVPVTSPKRPRAVAPALALGAGRDLYVAYLDVGDDRLDYAGGHEGRGGDPYPGRWSLVLARSTDGGATWKEAVVDPGIVPTQRFLQLSPPAPSLVVNRNRGRFHIGFHDGRLGDADVWVWTSRDTTTWSAPRRVNDTAKGDGRSQYLPQLAVSPNGRLDVIYYDRRSDAANHLNEVSLQSSFDTGDTFSPRVMLSDRPFDARRGPGWDRDLPDLGNRLGLLATHAESLAVWTDTRSATKDIVKQVLARALTTFSPGSTFRGPFRAAGWLAIAAAAVALLAVLTRPYRYRRRAGTPETQ